MTVPNTTALVDAADPGTDADRRLDALRQLAGTIGERPIPLPQWRPLAARISAELSRRARAENRSADAVLRAEVESAVVLAAADAVIAGRVAFETAYMARLRTRVATYVLAALLPDEAEPLGDAVDDLAADVDEAHAADAADLVARLPDLVDFAPAEIEALRGELTGDAPQTAAHRTALSKARKRARAACSEKISPPR
ncbi:MAG TPA: hypothetical protein PJ986_04150 [Gammaproteobacteria bacterium]|nr:hypothetical protein [Gammaproteobacteria bacterium]